MFRLLQMVESSTSLAFPMAILMLTYFVQKPSFVLVEPRYLKCSTFSISSLSILFCFFSILSGWRRIRLLFTRLLRGKLLKLKYWRYANISVFQDHRQKTYHRRIFLTNDLYRTSYIFSLSLWTMTAKKTLFSSTWHYIIICTYFWHIAIYLICFSL